MTVRPAFVLSAGGTRYGAVLAGTPKKGVKRHFLVDAMTCISASQKFTKNYCCLHNS